MSKYSVHTDYWLLALTILVIAFHGEPDIIDAIVYKLTGVWQVADWSM